MEHNQPTPFSEPLGPYGDQRSWHEKFHEFALDKNHLVRSCDLEIAREVTKMAGHSNIEIAKLVKSVFERLESYGLRLPNPKFLLGKDPEGTPSLLTVVDKIDGVNFDDIEPLPIGDQERYRDILDQLCCTVYQYIADSIDRDLPYYDDFNEGQFMLGTGPKDHDPQIYFVDLGPSILNPEGQAPRDVERWRVRSIVDPINMILSFEEKLGGLKLEKARVKAKQLSGRFNPKGFYSKGHLAEIKPSLR